MGGVITVFSVEDCLCLLKVSEHFLCLQATVCHSETKVCLERRGFKTCTLVEPLFFQSCVCIAML